MTEERSIRLAVGVAAEDLATGKAFDVTVMTPGPANGYVFPEGPLREAAPMFEGATVFLNHIPLSEAAGGTRRVEDIAGVLSGASWRVDSPSGTGGIRAVLSTAGPKGGLVGQLAVQILKDRAAGASVPDVGLSADILVRLAADSKTVLAISKVFSVDVVFNPARGGVFERVLNAVQSGAHSSTEQDGRYNVADGMGDSGVGGDRVPGAGSGASGAGAGAGQASPSRTADGGASDGAALEQVRATLADIEAARLQAERVTQEQLKLGCASLLGVALQASTLPAVMKDEVREQFANRVFAADELNAAISRKEDVYAKLIEGSVIRGMGIGGGVVARGMRDSMDRVQAAANQLLGAPVPENMRDTPRLSGIRELYIMLTGDYDFHGVFHPERVQLANATTVTMSSVVKNAMNCVMIDYFNMNPKWWAPIAHEEDFATMDTVTWLSTGGFGDLPVVAEGAVYTELTWGDHEETSTFTKRGGFIGVTLEMIDRDRVAAVKAIPRKLGLAAYRTVSTLVSALFTANAGTGPVLSDGFGLFNAANHLNLGVAALNWTSWEAGVQAMYGQLEQISLKPLGLRPQYILVPIELERTALTMFTSPQLSGSPNNDVNVRQMPADRVITVPEWTDANDWAAAADPRQAAGVCIGYRFGRAPELFVADDNSNGTMFTNDEMRIKARFVVTVGIGDYRALYKANVV